MKTLKPRLPTFSWVAIYCRHLLLLSSRCLPIPSPAQIPPRDCWQPQAGAQADEPGSVTVTAHPRWLRAGMTSPKETRALPSPPCTASAPGAGCSHAEFPQSLRNAPRILFFSPRSPPNRRRWPRTHSLIKRGRKKKIQ